VVGVMGLRQQGQIDIDVGVRLGGHEAGSSLELRWWRVKGGVTKDAVLKDLGHR
jgi:hypothetical protein